MHKYILKLTKYSEQGALTNEVTFKTADSAQALSDIKTQYEKMRYSTTTEEGKVTIGGKMYKVEPMQGEYVGITDWEQFCAVNAVLR